MKFTGSILLVAICLLPLLAQQVVLAEPFIGKTYFKDGKVDANGDKTYLLDYATGQGTSTSPLIRLEPVEGANAVVTDTQVLMDGAMKIPVSNNPNAYDIVPLTHYDLDIKRVEAINGGQLNNYTLENMFGLGSHVFTETSPTTATLTQILDLSKEMSIDEPVVSEEQQYDASDLERQLQLAKEKIKAKQELGFYN
jgi:hypothetical protein